MILKYLLMLTDKISSNKIYYKLIKIYFLKEKSLMKVKNRYKMVIFSFNNFKIFKNYNDN